MESYTLLNWLIVGLDWLILGLKYTPLDSENYKGLRVIIDTLSELPGGILHPINNMCVSWSVLCLCIPWESVREKC